MFEHILRISVTDFKDVNASWAIFPLSARTTNPFRQLLPKGEDLPVRDFRKWKIFPKRNKKDLHQKAIKSEAISL